jgi:hypothetical protein
MSAQTATVIDLDEYRTRRVSRARERSMESEGIQAIWWFPVLMWLPVPVPALYWNSTTLK